MIIRYRLVSMLDRSIVSNFYNTYTEAQYKKERSLCKSVVLAPVILNKHKLPWIDYFNS